MSETIGYARISTAAQSLQLQLDALQPLCAKVFSDTVSGAQADRPGLHQALHYVRPGDTLLIWKLDRLGRNVRGLIDLSADLDRRGVNLRSLTDGIDTSTSAGRLFFHVLAAVAEMERELILERSRAGRAAAKSRGRVGGRPRAIPGKALARARSLFAAGADVPTVAAHLGVSVSTVYRHIPAPQRQIDFIERDAANRQPA